MIIKEIAFSCYPVTDMERARAFYEGIPFHFGPLETPVCHMAFVRDPDGNSLGIHSRKKNHH